LRRERATDPFDGVRVGAFERETVRLSKHDDIHERERSARRFRVYKPKRTTTRSMLGVRDMT